MRPPVTVVLVNNGGGGIFDFLPIADEVPKDTFTQLWSTPQNVDLAGTPSPNPLRHTILVLSPCLVHACYTGFRELFDVCLSFPFVCDYAPMDESWNDFSSARL